MNRFGSLTGFVFALGLAACSSGEGTDGSGGMTGAGGGLMSGTGSVSGGGGGTSLPGTGGALGSGGSATGGAAATGGETGSGGTTAVTCTVGTGTEDISANSFTDKATCLSWQKLSTVAGPISNRAALAHCQALTQDGLTWRLPTGPEIRSYPNLPDNGNAYLAGPTYIPSNSSDEMTGCTGNGHTCNVTQYSPGNFACTWQGPGANSYPVLCVSGAAAAGTLNSAFEAATCCSAGVSTYKEADCSSYGDAN